MESNYKNLKVWKRSINFVTGIYKITEKFPSDEKFWLVSQMRRASISIPSNIAEWSWRNGINEFKQFLHISKASCMEVDTQLMIAKNLSFITDEIYTKFNEELNEIIKMIQWLLKSIK